ncbi:hypothetical protein GCM10010116_53440 [Microbispora rosea subsp. aerata]|nr:hypothetical protein [Microbispora rosea]GGO26634.1 hypothetical protein GCM10010116_53440 [Microbispora rosea subsp. aerata]GIH58381.1 hypothetical protein Mro02_52950 [Microbispora rosea subsp. aerata]GLJ84046.1 hypothetical protein GCM10017588_27740 [Microbispora rosea subsp. aerata]
MPPIDQITAYASAHPVGTVIISVIGLVLLTLAFFALRALVRLFRRWASTRPTEDVLTIVAASIATGVSAQGMWRFSGDVLGFDGPLRLLLFAFIEVAVITSAVRARRNMRENYSAGIDGVAVWVFTSLSAVLSSMDARSVAEAVFRLAAPLVAAWLWERGMAIERVRITGRGRINWRITPERVLVRIGLAEASDRTASEVDAHRRLTRVALAAKRVRALREAGASERKLRAAMAKLDKAMDQAVEYTGLAVDEKRQEALLSQIGALYNTSALIDLAPPVPWAPEREEPQAPPALPAAAIAELIDDEEEDIPAEPAPVVDTAQRAAQLRAARAYWDQQIARKYVPRAADIAQEVGIPLTVAREWRALWKLEPQAHALIEAAFREHGIVDTGTFPAIEVPERERVLVVNGSTPGGAAQNS